MQLDVVPGSEGEQCVLQGTLDALADGELVGYSAVLEGDAPNLQLEATVKQKEDCC